MSKAIQRRDTPMEVSLKGALAGLVGTFVLTTVMRRTERLLASADPVRTGGPAGD